MSPEQIGPGAVPPIVSGPSPAPAICPEYPVTLARYEKSDPLPRHVLTSYEIKITDEYFSNYDLADPGIDLLDNSAG